MINILLRAYKQVAPICHLPCLQFRHPIRFQFHTINKFIRQKPIQIKFGSVTQALKQGYQMSNQQQLDDCKNLISQISQFMYSNKYTIDEAIRFKIFSGQTFEQLKELAASSANYESALKIIYSLQPEQQLAYAEQVTIPLHQKLANVYINLNQMQLAVANLEKILSWKINVLKTQQHAEVVILMKKIAKLKSQMGQLQQAVDLEERIIANLTKLVGQNSSQVAACNYSIGSMYFAAANYQRAIQYFKTAIRKYELASDNIQGLAQAYTSLASCYRAIEQYDLTLEILSLLQLVYTKNINYGEKCNEVAQVYIKKADILKLKSNWKEAEVELTNAYELQQHIFPTNNIHIAKTEMQFAHLYLALKKFTDAEDAFKKALRKLELLQPDSSEVKDCRMVVTKHLAELSLASNRPQQALKFAQKYFSQSLTADQTEETNIYLGIASNLLGRINLTLKKVPEAQKNFETAKSIFQQHIEDEQYLHPELISAYMQLSEMYKRQSKYNLAIQCLQNSRRLMLKYKTNTQQNIALLNHTINTLKSRTRGKKVIKNLN